MIRKPKTGLRFSLRTGLPLVTLFAFWSVSIPDWSLDEISDQDLANLSHLNEIVVLEFQCRFARDQEPSSVFAKMVGRFDINDQRSTFSLARRGCENWKHGLAPGGTVIDGLPQLACQTPRCIVVATKQS